MKCKKVGYYVSVCKMKFSNDLVIGNRLSGRKKGFGEIKYLEEVVDEDIEDDEVLGIFVVKDFGKNGYILIFVLVMLD